MYMVGLQHIGFTSTSAVIAVCRTIGIFTAFFPVDKLLCLMKRMQRNNL
jgi:hypothetical protein